VHEVADDADGLVVDALENVFFFFSR